MANDIGQSVVIIGAGHAGTTAAFELRRRGYSGAITLLSAETSHPYERPPLTKGLLAGYDDADDIAIAPDQTYADQGIELVHDPAVDLRPVEHQVALASGRQLSYTTGVLALGACPAPIGLTGIDGADVYRPHTLEGALALRDAMSGAPRRVTVIGGGLLGLEAAATLRTSGHDVTVVEHAGRLLSRSTSPVTADAIQATHEQQGVRVLCRSRVVNLGRRNGRVRSVHVDPGLLLMSDSVVLASGMRPRTSLACAAGLRVNDGVVVDAGLRTSAADLYAIGDCAVVQGRSGQLRQLTSVQNAVEQAATLADRVMGGRAHFVGTAATWSDQFDLRVQLAGSPAGGRRTVLTGDLDELRFNVFVFDQHDTLCAVESIGRPADHIWARRLLSAGTDLTPCDVSAADFSLRAAAEGTRIGA